MKYMTLFVIGLLLLASNQKDKQVVQETRCRLYGDSEKNWTKSSINKLENFRAYDIRNIFFLQQKMEKKNELQIFDKDTPFDLKKLRRDSATHLKIPTFLEKRFEPFGPTLISKFI